MWQIMISVFVGMLIGIFLVALLFAAKVTSLQDQFDTKCDQCPLRRRADYIDALKGQRVDVKV
jgi:formate/nitrite transporter FocA (FNT family)